MKRPYQVTGTVLLLFAVFTAWESLNLKYYSSLGPGPGFFPFWLAVILGVLAALMLYHATFRQSAPLPEDFFPTRIGYLRLLAVLAAMAGVVLLIIPLGFRLAMFPFYVFLLSALGRQNPVVTVLISLAGSFGVYHVFVEWLKVPLPVGGFGI